MVDCNGLLVAEVKGHGYETDRILSRMIAATPELLQDCIEGKQKVCLFMCTRPLRGKPTHCDLCQRMQATIAKASEGT